MRSPAPVHMWVVAPPGDDVRKRIERIARAPDVAHVAVMPDVHAAGSACNGLVLGTHRLVYPAAVGGDIGCGYAAVALDRDADALDHRDAAERLLAALPAAVPIVRHRRRDDPPELSGALSPRELSAGALAARATADGRLECGTLGRGNHFLEFQADEAERLWIMVHSGSRAMGQHITTLHLERATLAAGGLAWLDTDTPAGQAYLHDLGWARRYASESRRRMLEAAAGVARDILGCRADWSTLLDADHNHVQAEMHDGGSLLVHRKGANRAPEHAPNLIPGSMATHTYRVTGRGTPGSLASSSHGAGRRFSRGAARSRIRRRDVERQLAGVWIDPRVAARLVDEVPSAYRDIHAVMRAQRELVRIVWRLRPVLSYKGV